MSEAAQIASGMQTMQTAPQIATRSATGLIDYSDVKPLAIHAMRKEVKWGVIGVNQGSPAEGQKLSMTINSEHFLDPMSAYLDIEFEITKLRIYVDFDIIWENIKKSIDQVNLKQRSHDQIVRNQQKLTAVYGKTNLGTDEKQYENITLFFSTPGQVHDFVDDMNKCNIKPFAVRIADDRTQYMDIRDPNTITNPNLHWDPNDDIVLETSGSWKVVCSDMVGNNGNFEWVGDVLDNLPGTGGGQYSPLHNVYLNDVNTLSVNVNMDNNLSPYKPLGKNYGNLLGTRNFNQQTEIILHYVPTNKIGYIPMSFNSTGHSLIARQIIRAAGVEIENIEHFNLLMSQLYSLKAGSDDIQQQRMYELLNTPFFVPIDVAQLPQIFLSIKSPGPIQNKLNARSDGLDDRHNFAESGNLQIFHGNYCNGSYVSAFAAGQSTRMVEYLRKIGIIFQSPARSYIFNEAHAETPLDLSGVTLRDVTQNPFGDVGLKIIDKDFQFSNYDRLTPQTGSKVPEELGNTMESATHYPGITLLVSMPATAQDHWNQPVVYENPAVQQKTYSSLDTVIDEALMEPRMRSFNSGVEHGNYYVVSNSVRGVYSFDILGNNVSRNVKGLWMDIMTVNPNNIQNKVGLVQNIPNQIFTRDSYASAYVDQYPTTIAQNTGKLEVVMKELAQEAFVGRIYLPLMSSVMGMLMPADSHKYIPLAAFPNLTLEFETFRRPFLPTVVENYKFKQQGTHQRGNEYLFGSQGLMYRRQRTMDSNQNISHDQYTDMYHVGDTCADLLTANMVRGAFHPYFVIKRWDLRATLMQFDRSITQSLQATIASTGLFLHTNDYRLVKVLEISQGEHQNKFLPFRIDLDTQLKSCKTMVMLATSTSAIQNLSGIHAAGDLHLFKKFESRRLEIRKMQYHAGSENFPHEILDQLPTGRKPGFGADIHLYQEFNRAFKKEFNLTKEHCSIRLNNQGQFDTIPLGYGPEYNVFKIQNGSLGTNQSASRIEFEQPSTNVIYALDLESISSDTGLISGLNTIVNHPVYLETQALTNNFYDTTIPTKSAATQRDAWNKTHYSHDPGHSQYINTSLLNLTMGGLHNINKSGAGDQQVPYYAGLETILLNKANLIQTSVIPQTVVTGDLGAQNQLTLHGFTPSLTTNKIGGNLNVYENVYKQYISPYDRGFPLSASNHGMSLIFWYIADKVIHVDQQFQIKVLGTP